ncbi:MAG: hypothetical protein ACT4OF_04855 [Caulobacteraceae bacterium]
MNDIAQPFDLTPLWTRTRAMFARAQTATGGAAKIAAVALMTLAMRKEIVGCIARLENIVRKLLFAEAARLAPPPCARGPRLVQIPLRGMAQHYSPAASQNRSAGPRARTCANLASNCAPDGARSNFEPSRDRSAGLLARTCTNVANKCAPERARAIDLTRPETWRARFALALPRDPRRVPDARAPRILNPWGPPPPPPPPRTHTAPKPEDSPFRLARRFEALRRVFENPAPYARRLAHLMRRLVRHYREGAMCYAMTPARVGGFDRYDPRLSIECCGQAYEGVFAFPPDTS